MNISTHKKLFAPFILFAFLIVGLFGLFHFAMDMNNGGSAFGCPFMGIAALCAMNPLDHIATWQSTFTASFSKEIFSLLALVFLIILFAFRFKNFRRIGGAPQISTDTKRSTVSILTTKNQLQEAFSSGILHSKLYNSPAYC